MTTSIFYLQTGKTAEQWESILPKIKPIIKDFAEGKPSVGANFEKLKGYNIYSFRLNKKERVLFTTFAHQGQQQILLLTILTNHKHNRSPFLKEDFLRKFVENNKAGLTNAVEPETNLSHSFTTDFTFPSLETPGASVLKPVFFDNGTPLAFDEEQGKALSIPLPGIIVGPPGSGKTSVLKSLVISAVMNIRANEQHTQFPGAYEVMYVTLSEALCHAVKKDWENIAQTLDVPRHVNIHIFTYQNLMHHLGYQNTLNYEQTSIHFNTWHQNYIKQKMVKKSIVSEVIKKNELLRTEFRMISGYTEAEYLQGLGDKQSNFNDPKERQLVYKAYTHWKTYLEKENLISDEFFIIPKSDTFSIKKLFGDEGQDFSLAQVRSLINLSDEDKQMVFCLDPNQNIKDNRQNNLGLQKLLSKVAPSGKVNVITLDTTYRCPANVIAFAEVFLNVRKTIPGTHEKKPFTMQPSQIPGEVVWCSKENLNPLFLEKIQQSADICVITDNEAHLKEAKALFQIPQVFDITNVKGLQFNDVILYHLLENETLKEINRDGNADDALRCLALRFVATTRALKTTYFFAPSNASQTQLSKSLQEKATVLSKTEPLVFSDYIEASQKRWLEQAKKLLNENLEDTAKAILSRHVFKSETASIDIEAWIKAHKPVPPESPAIQAETVPLPRNIASAKAKKANKQKPETKNDTKNTVRIETALTNDLSEAIRSENVSKCIELLKEGAKIDVKDNRGMTNFILMFTSLSADHLEKLLQVIGSHKIAVDKKDCVRLMEKSGDPPSKYNLLNNFILGHMNLDEEISDTENTLRHLGCSENHPDYIDRFIESPFSKTIDQASFIKKVLPILDGVLFPLDFDGRKTCLFIKNALLHIDFLDKNIFNFFKLIEPVSNNKLHSRSLLMQTIISDKNVVFLRQFFIGIPEFFRSFSEQVRSKNEEIIGFYMNLFSGSCSPLLEASFHAEINNLFCLAIEIESEPLMSALKDTHARQPFWSKNEYTLFLEKAMAVDNTDIFQEVLKLCSSLKDRSVFTTLEKLVRLQKQELLDLFYKNFYSYIEINEDTTSAALMVHKAIEEKNIDLVQFILKNRKILSEYIIKRTADRSTIISTSIKAGNDEILTLIFETLENDEELKLHIDFYDSDFLCAVNLKNTKAIELFLKTPEFNPNKPEIISLTVEQDDIELFKTLIKHPNFRNYVEFELKTLFSYLLERKKRHFIALLLEYSDQESVLDSIDNLNAAVEANDIEIVTACLKATADKISKDYNHDFRWQDEFPTENKEIMALLSQHFTKNMLENNTAKKPPTTFSSTAKALTFTSRNTGDEPPLTADKTKAQASRGMS